MGEWNTVSGDAGFVSHEDYIVEIVQEVNDILDAVFGGILGICVAY